MKRIGLLTSGGDAPGMNACIRAVVRTALYYGMEVYGIERGYQGLIDDEMIQMEMRTVSNIVQSGGTKLRTARCLEMLTKAGQRKAVKTLEARGIEGLVVIGGDGSFRGAKCLSEEYGIPTIGIPGTIDNDLEYTDYTLGFDTAVNTCIDVINKLRDTMTSHERISVVEVMGRRCGDIALFAGIASGAEIIVVPEVVFDLDDIVMKINRSRAKIGRASCRERVCKAASIGNHLFGSSYDYRSYPARRFALHGGQNVGCPVRKQSRKASERRYRQQSGGYTQKRNYRYGHHRSRKYEKEIQLRAV